MIQNKVASCGGKNQSDEFFFESSSIVTSIIARMMEMTIWVNVLISIVCMRLFNKEITAQLLKKLK